MLTFAVETKRARLVIRQRPVPTMTAMYPSWQVHRANVRHILRSPTSQPKLTIGASNDVYEQEAERVADQVMRMQDPGAKDVPLQRMCLEREEELQRQPLEENEEEIQAKQIAGTTPLVTPEAEAGITSLRGGGQQLPGSTRQFFEPRFGSDFSHVRVHTDNRAAETARAVDARAYTLGSDIAFGSGEYAPGSGEGRRLLAHELTHVVQQASLRTVRLQRAPLGDLKSGGAATRLQLEGTNEYRAYMDQQLVWQKDLALTPDEAWLAVGLMLRDMQAGATVVWHARARDYATRAQACGAGKRPSVPARSSEQVATALDLHIPRFRNLNLPSRSECRGACGPDCPSTCTPQPDQHVCLPGTSTDCHWIVVYDNIIRCGTHAGCRDHDACYDQCAATQASGWCWRGCDSNCVRQHGIGDCNRWRTGNGTFDAQLLFAAGATVTGPFPSGCPAPSP